MEFELPLLQYFQRNNEYSAAKDGMRYFVSPQKEVVRDETGAPCKNAKGEDETIRVLQLTIWPDPWALRRTDPALHQVTTYPLTEEGRTALLHTLAQRYDAEQERWQNCPGVLDCEPWYPAEEPSLEEGVGCK